MKQNKVLRYPVPVFCLTLSVLAALPAVSSAQTASPWSSPATWGGRLPRAGDAVTIPKGKTVLLDTQTPALKGLIIEGSLIAGNTDIGITSNYVVVRGGRLQIGSATTPFTRRATITLTGTSTADIPAIAGLGAKVLGVEGGTLELHGNPAAKSWTRLSGDVVAGARQITLADAPGWKAGDQILLATSSRKMEEYDLAEVSAVSGKVVTLRQPLKYRHLGTVRQVGDRRIDIRAEVGLLSRNIIVQGDDRSEALKIGGHAMFMNGICPMTSMPGCQCNVTSRRATVQIANAEFRRMGQLNVLGRYPIHFHMMGQTTNCYVRNTAVHDTIQRGIVLHDVSNVNASGNVIFNTVGHNFVVETENTTGNVIDGNLALMNRQANPLQTNPTLVSQNDRLPSNYWMKSGRNTMINNVAAGSFDSGFNYDSILSDGPIIFRNNVAHAAMNQEGEGLGDFDLSAGVLIVSQEERPAGDQILDTLVYHNAIGMWPEEAGLFRIERIVAVDNDLHTENRGVGNRVLYKDALFVGTLTEPREFPGSPVHFQYGSDVTLESPTFANFAGGGIAAATDIGVATQANLWVSNARYIGPRPWAAMGDDMTVTYLDNSVVTPGTYVFEPQYATPESILQTVGMGEESTTIWRCPRRYGYTELDVRNRANVGERIHTTTQIRRSDGLRFTGGMFGYSVIYNAGLGYEILAPSASGYAFKLHNGATFDPVVDRLSTFVEVVVPVLAAPRNVYRTGTDFDMPDPPVATNRLRLATSRADFQANPLTTYFYDVATKKVLVKASSRWIIVAP